MISASRILLCTVVLALGASAAAAAHTRRASAIPRNDAEVEREQHDADIDFYLSRVEKDSSGAIDLLRLATLYLQRARERGTPADLSLAEGAARRSLANRSAHNAEAWHALSLSLMGQHRFVEAKIAADSLLAVDPAAPAPRALVGEILLELGRYPEADTIFRALDHGNGAPAILSRIARWSSLRGDAAHARLLLLQAQAEVRRHAGVPLEQQSWYDLRLGDLALANGAFSLAARHFRAAQATVDDDPRILLAQARLAMALRNPRSALRFAEMAMNAGEDPVAFAIASDAHTALGDSVSAERFFRAFETAIAAAPPSAWHRQWRLALLDHDRQIAAVLHQAQDELQSRRDIYAWDLYAWALHHVGRDAEARAAMREALRWNTQDVALTAHARVLGIQP